jgi:hypothetical protein
MDDPQRDALWQEASERNNRLEHLIEAITQLVARSRDVLPRARPEGSAPAGNAKMDHETRNRPAAASLF